MADRYVAIHESKARTRKLPGYEEPADWHEDNGWALFECDDAGVPVRLVFCDRMEPEDAILVRDLRPLVAELNRLASRAPSPPETPAPPRSLAETLKNPSFRARVDALKAGMSVKCTCGKESHEHYIGTDGDECSGFMVDPASPASSPTDPATKEQS